jgi:DNA-binding MarR family transcriptional regulator
VHDGAARDGAAILDAIRRIVRFLRLADRDAAATHGIGAAQWFVLAQLAEAPHTSINELAARTLTDQSSVSTVVARLVAQGLIARRPGEDRRRVELALTARGRAITRRGGDLPQDRILRGVAALPPARRAVVVDALRELIRAIGADAVEPRMLFEDEAAPARAPPPRGAARRARTGTARSGRARSRRPR